jgi:manganese/zinc/iron transport system substrate-binding protein
MVGWFKKVIFASLVLASCSSPQRGWFEENGKIKALATTAQVGFLVSAIGGDRVDVWILIRGDVDPHSYELVKGDGERLDRADVVYYNGLGLEHGAALSSWLKGSQKAVAVGDAIAKRASEKILYKESTIDPHVWMDISLWREGIDAVVEGLSRADPERSEEYRARGEALSEEMMTAHKELWAKLHSVPSEKRYLVTSHDAFHYFTRGYLAEIGEENWGERFAAPEGLAPEGQLNGRDIQNIVAYLYSKKVEVLFPESNVSRDSVRKVADAGLELGLKIRVCPEPLYGDSMSGLGYLEMMRKNGSTIQRYLSCTR